jgi:hypothetical protein
MVSMSTTPIVTAVGALGLVFGAAVLNTGVDVWNAAFGPRPFLAVRELSVDLAAQTVTQQIVPVHTARLQATWAARVDRPGEAKPICEGDGAGTYDGQRRTWSASEWAGAHCPPLQAGDTLTASWRWGEGVRGQVSTTVTVE